MPLLAFPSALPIAPTPPHPPSAHDTVRGILILQIGTLHSETLRVIRISSTLQIFQHDSLLVE